MTHQPDYRVLVDAANNRRPAYLPLYEHGVSPVVAEALSGREMVALQASDDAADLDELYRRYADFFVQSGYDIMPFEGGICPILPEGGALMGERAGVIRDEASLRAYPWDELPALYWRAWDKHFAAIGRTLPPGMKAVGGIGYGVFEVAQDLAGYESLAFLHVDEPDAFTDLFRRIGDLMVGLWRTLLERHADTFCLCRFGDDLGFKTSTLLSPPTIVEYIVPQYRRIIELIHDAGKPFLLHSCGAIFPVMDELIDAGIDAKHSNEDVICDFDEWLERYNDRIALFGGLDMDVVERKPEDEVYAYVRERAPRYRKRANGFAIGTGNQIGPKTPPQNMAAMLRAVHDTRADEIAS